jgi:exopolyphosphatase / guanosine-5'-triphosphate,3'-diphosphate pyrophosphatase
VTRLAALDLGSNSFHLLVADALGPSESGGPGRRRLIKRITTRKLTLRLGDAVSATGELGREARRAARQAVAELLADARAAGATGVVVVATDALRTAADGDKVRQRLREDHGLRVCLLDGMQEGLLSLRAMAAALHVRDEEGLLGLDLGGGSYEVVYGGVGPLLAGASLPLGGAKLRPRLANDPPRLAERVALHEHAMRFLRPVAAEVARVRGRMPAPLPAAGTAGTIRDLGRLGLGLATGAAPQRIRGVVVTRDQLEHGYARLCSVPAAERVELPGVSPKRADLLPAGGAVLLATMEAFGLQQLVLCDWGLREGVLLDALSDGRVVSPADFAPL